MGNDKFEVLCRLFAIDDEYTYTEKRVPALLFPIMKSVSKRTLNDIENDIICRRGVDFTATWFLQYKNQCCKFIEIDPKDCVVDDRHSFNYRKCFPCKAGTFLIEILNKDFITVLPKVHSLKECYKFMIENMPPIVNKVDDYYEVRMGNHRIMSAILDGEKKIKALTFCQPNDKKVIKSMDELYGKR